LPASHSSSGAGKPRPGEAFFNSRVLGPSPAGCEVWNVGLRFRQNNSFLAGGPARGGAVGTGTRFHGILRGEGSRDGTVAGRVFGVRGESFRSTKQTSDGCESVGTFRQKKEDCKYLCPGNGGIPKRSHIKLGSVRRYFRTAQVCGKKTEDVYSKTRELYRARPLVEYFGFWTPFVEAIKYV